MPHVDIFMGRGGLLQRIAAVYDGFQFSRLDKFFNQQQAVFFLAGCGPILSHPQSKANRKPDLKRIYDSKGVHK